MRRITVLIFLVTLASTLSACANQLSGASVTGTITYLGQTTTLANSTINVRLIDALNSDTPNQMVSEQSVQNPGSGPFRFNLAYNPDQIEPTHIYTVQAKVIDPSGRVTWTTAQPYPVITNGNPTHNLDLTLAYIVYVGPTVNGTPATIPNTGSGSNQPFVENQLPQTVLNNQPSLNTDDSWARVQSAGKLTVGINANYPPFAFYTQDNHLDGFDFALINAVSQKLGVPLDIKDISLDALNNDLLFKQIDAGIGAIAVSPDRQRVVDFSNIYLTSNDAFLARQDSPISNLPSLTDLGNYKIAVQKGTAFEQWLKTNLVNTGKMEAINLLSTDTVDQAIQALKSGEVELVMLDSLSANNFVQNDNLKLVGKDFNQQLYAIALPKGATSLENQINNALLQIQNDGTLANLAKKYLNQPIASIQPAPTSPPTETPTPTPTATPAPTNVAIIPTPTSNVCYDGMSFVQDLTYPDYNLSSPALINAGQLFQKGWRIRNSGTCTWTSSYSLNFVDGNTPGAQMGGLPVYIQYSVPPGTTYDLYVNLIAPTTNGTYQGFWQMRNAIGAYFGDRISVGITSGNGVLTSLNPPLINLFNAQPNSIIAGQCIIIQWQVLNSVNTVNILRDSTVIWGGAPATGSTQDCPPGTGTVTYSLDAFGLYGESKLAAPIQVLGVVPAAASNTPTATQTQPAPISTSPTPTQVFPPTPIPTRTGTLVPPLPTRTPIIPPTSTRVIPPSPTTAPLATPTQIVLPTPIRIPPPTPVDRRPPSRGVISPPPLYNLQLPPTSVPLPPVVIPPPVMPTQPVAIPTPLPPLPIRRGIAW